MATNLTNQIKRETSIMHDGAQVIVILDPGTDGKPLLHFRAKGRRWQVTTPLEDAFAQAMNAADKLTPDEIETLRNTKAKIMINPSYSPTESQAICDTIDAQIATTESIQSMFDDNDDNDDNEGDTPKPLDDD